MDNESDKDPRPRTWANSGWRQATAIDPGVGDPSADRLVAGTLDEQRSFGTPAGTVSLGHVLVRDTHGPHEVWAHAAGRDLSVTQLTPQPCRGHLLRANLGDMGFDAGRSTATCASGASWPRRRSAWFR
jgi:hypothetical protein